jgi:hypothetical protein
VGKKYRRLPKEISKLRNKAPPDRRSHLQKVQRRPRDNDFKILRNEFIFRAFIQTFIGSSGPKS